MEILEYTLSEVVEQLNESRHIVQTRIYDASNSL